MPWAVEARGQIVVPIPEGIVRLEPGTPPTTTRFPESAGIGVYRLKGLGPESLLMVAYGWGDGDERLLHVSPAGQETVITRPSRADSRADAEALRRESRQLAVGPAPEVLVVRVGFSYYLISALQTLTERGITCRTPVGELCVSEMTLPGISSQTSVVASTTALRSEQMNACWYGGDPSDSHARVGVCGRCSIDGACSAELRFSARAFWFLAVDDRRAVGFDLDAWRLVVIDLESHRRQELDVGAEIPNSYFFGTYAWLRPNGTLGAVVRTREPTPNSVAVLEYDVRSEGMALLGGWLKAGTTNPRETPVLSEEGFGILQLEVEGSGCRIRRFRQPP